MPKLDQKLSKDNECDQDAEIRRPPNAKVNSEEQQRHATAQYDTLSW